MREEKKNQGTKKQNLPALILLTIPKEKEKKLANKVLNELENKMAIVF